MPPQPITLPRIDSPHTEKLFIGMIAGLIVGGGVGYFIGDLLGEARGAASVPVYTPPTVVAPSPIQNTQTNPLQDVKVNPFE